MIASSTPLSITAPLHHEVETLRSVDLPTGTLRIVAPLIPGPRPAAPKQRLTARPVSHDLPAGAA